MREIIKEARNVDEAIELACQELGVPRDTVDFEIIHLPKRGFLGLKNTPAKVRVYLEEPEKPAPAPAPIPRPTPAPRVEKTPPPRPAAPRPAPPPPRTEPRPAPKPTPAEPLQEKAEPVKKPQEPTTPPVEQRFVSAETVDGKAKTAADYVKGVLAEMGVNAEISVAFTENGIILRLSGEGLGVIIGRRGETLDSLQYLAGLVANRQEGDYMRVTIDSGNYREKRERTLEQLAQKLSASAIRFGRPSTLEPMNPYERRIIHATVSRIEGVSSTSIGEEPNRRVVINPVNLKPQNRGARPAPSGNRPPRPPRRDARPGEDKPTGKTEFRPASDRAPQRDGQRPPFRREGGNRPPFQRDGNRPEAVKPTPTAIDREYAMELEKEKPVSKRPEPPVKPAAEQTIRESTSPTREQAPREGDDLPLYGKIEL